MRVDQNQVFKINHSHQSHSQKKAIKEVAFNQKWIEIRVKYLELKNNKIFQKQKIQKLQKI